MKSLLSLATGLCLSLASLHAAEVHKPADIPTITVSPGVLLKELTGLSASGDLHSARCSVAFFHLEPGKASAWSFNQVGEESFFILRGHGEVRTGTRSQPVKVGSFILVPAKEVRSIMASPDEAMEFYAITAPAWTKDDDVLTTDPKVSAK